jgi:uncharacterized protein
MALLPLRVFAYSSCGEFYETKRLAQIDLLSARIPQMGVGVTALSETSPISLAASRKSCRQFELTVRKDERRRLPLPRKAKKQKSRGVVDTSVLVAGISGFRKPYVRGKNTSADVLYKWAEKGNFVWLVTEDILDEYKEVLKRLRVRSTLIGAVINLIRERAEPVNVHASFEISPDPKDDPFCLCSEEGNADFIVTLNPKDFPQERLKAKVISPEAMP